MFGGMGGSRKVESEFSEKQNPKILVSYDKKLGLHPLKMYMSQGTINVLISKSTQQLTLSACAFRVGV